jgi:hypothetical protein
MTGSAEELCEFVNDKSKDKKASDNVSMLGCLGILSYAWFFWGLFTSQWFLCLIFFMWSFISTTLNKLFSKKPHAPEDLHIGAFIDLLFVILIVINCLWLHIDFYHLFMRLF